MTTRTGTDGKKYLDQVSIPAGKRGKHVVEHFTHPAGAVMHTGNIRTAIIGGQPNEPVVYDHATTWHRLKYDGGEWMTDLPIEQQQHRSCLAPIRGHVLVGGLGLGLAANWLAQRDSVESVTVVEISKDVVSLVEKHLRDPRGIVRVVRANLLTYLKAEAGNQCFDWAFYDIWQSDGEATFFKTVCPLRKLSVPFLDDSRVVCWNEDVMRGQLAFGLHGRYAASLGGWKGSPTLADYAHPKSNRSIWAMWSRDFFRAVERGAVTQKNFQDMAAVYAGTYGRPGFARTWKEYCEGS
jgi:hypothetical protein